MQEPTVEQQRQVIQAEIASLSMQYYQFKVRAKIAKDIDDGEMLKANVAGMEKCQKAVDSCEAMIEELNDEPAD